MAVLLEHDIKALLRSTRLLVPAGSVCRTPEEAQAAARQLGRAVVVKALIPTGRRGKAGGVLFAANPAEARDAAARLLAATLHQFPVEAVLVEERQAIAQELYVSLSIDGNARTWQVLFSAAGGVEVEQQLADGNLSRLLLDPSGAVRDFQARALVRQAGMQGAALARVGHAVADIARLAVDIDATLLEINPLAILQDGRVSAVGAMAALDDQALHRHPDLAPLALSGVDRVGRPLTPLEQRMQEIDALDPNEGQIRFSEFPDGDLGFMVLGGGAGMVALDALMRAGGQPATFFDMTAGNVEEKIYRATSAVLAMQRIRGLILGVNISAFAPVPIRIRGIARALRESVRDFAEFPVVIRMAGPQDDEAAAIMSEFQHVRYLRDEKTLEEAVELFMDLVDRRAA